MLCEQCKLKIEPYNECLECGIKMHICPRTITTANVKNCRYHKTINLIRKIVKPKEMADELIEAIREEIE